MVFLIHLGRSWKGCSSTDAFDALAHYLQPLELVFCHLALGGMWVMEMPMGQIACNQRLPCSVWLCWLDSLIALLALLRPSLAQWSWGPVCADWNCPLGAALNALHAWGCACKQGPSETGLSAKVLVWAVSALRGAVENANALKLLPSSAACGKYSGLSRSTGSESIERVTEYSPQAAELRSRFTGNQDIHKSAGRTGHSSL